MKKDNTSSKMASEMADAKPNRTDDVDVVALAIPKKLPVNDLSDALVCYVELPEDDTQPLLVSEIRTEAARAKRVPPEHIVLIDGRTSTRELLEDDSAAFFDIGPPPQAGPAPQEGVSRVPSTEQMLDSRQQPQPKESRAGQPQTTRTVTEADFHDHPDAKRRKQNPTCDSSSSSSHNFAVGGIGLGVLSRASSNVSECSSFGAVSGEQESEQDHENEAPFVYAIVHQEKQEALAEAQALLIGDDVLAVDDNWETDIDAFFEKFPEIAGHDLPTTAALVDRVSQELMLRLGVPVGDVADVVFRKSSAALKANKRFLLRLFTQARKGVSELYNMLSEEQCDDDELVALAVRMHEGAFLNASQRLQQRPHIVLEALDSANQSRPQDGGEVFTRLSEDIRSDKFFAQDVWRHRHSSHLIPEQNPPRTFLDYFSTSLLEDEDVLVACITRDLPFENMPSPLLLRRDFVMDHVLGTLCEDSDRVESFFSCDTCACYRSDREIMRELIRADGANFRFASLNLRKDRELQLMALESEKLFSPAHGRNVHGVEEAEAALAGAVAAELERLVLIEEAGEHARSTAEFLAAVYMRCPIMVSRLNAGGRSFGAASVNARWMMEHDDHDFAQKAFGLLASSAVARGITGKNLDGYLWTFTRLDSYQVKSSTNAFEYLNLHAPSPSRVAASISPNEDPKILQMRQKALDDASLNNNDKSGTVLPTATPSHGNPRDLVVEILARQGLSGLTSLVPFLSSGVVSEYALADLCKEAGHLLVLNNIGRHSTSARPSSVAVRNIAEAINTWTCPYPLPKALRDDEEFVCDLLGAGWFDALLFASDAVRRRDSVVRVAVEQFGFDVLWYVSEEYAQKKEIIMAAARAVDTHTASATNSPLSRRHQFQRPRCWLSMHFSNLVDRSDLRADPDFFPIMARIIPVAEMWDALPKKFRDDNTLALKFVRECARAGEFREVLDMWVRLSRAQQSDPAFLAAVESNLFPNTQLSQLPFQFLDCLLPEQRATAVAIFSACTVIGQRDDSCFSFWKLPSSAQSDGDIYLAVARQLLRYSTRTGLKKGSRVPWVLRDNLMFIRALAEIDSQAAVAIASSRVLADREFVLETIKRVSTTTKIEESRPPNESGVVDEGLMIVASNHDESSLYPQVQPNHPQGVIINLLACTSRKNCRDEQLIREAVMRDGEAISEASWALRNSPEIGLLAVKQNGLALRYLSCELAKSQKICLAAVQNNGLALQYCSMEIRSSSPEIVRAAVDQNAAAWRFVRGEKLLSDSNLFRVACSGHTPFFCFSVGFMERDPDFFTSMLTGEKGNVLLLAFCNLTTDPLIYDREAMRKIVRKNGMALAFTPLRSDAALAMLAVRNTGVALRYVAPSLLAGDNGKAIVLAALRSEKSSCCAEVLEAVPPRLLASDPEVQEAASCVKKAMEKAQQARREASGFGDIWDSKPRKLDFTADDFAHLATAVSSSTDEEMVMAE
ncbi:unnamed protein product [Amoebophrya sp. A120]|nr:unnamed protein product [Amoebophrya sp. A120]|eukprot:GSA120T00002289001.1